MTAPPVTTTPDLKPCPFCGGPVKLEKAHVQRHELHGERQFWGVVCRNTLNVGGSCCMEQVPSASKEAAIARWNRRVVPMPEREMNSSATLTGSTVMTTPAPPDDDDYYCSCGSAPSEGAEDYGVCEFCKRPLP